MYFFLEHNNKTCNASPLFCFLCQIVSVFYTNPSFTEGQYITKFLRNGPFGGGESIKVIDKRRPTIFNICFLTSMYYH
jgi:hypothetical protein